MSYKPPPRTWDEHRVVRNRRTPFLVHAFDPVIVEPLADLSRLQASARRSAADDSAFVITKSKAIRKKRARCSKTARSRARLLATDELVDSCFKFVDQNRACAVSRRHLF